MKLACQNKFESVSNGQDRSSCQSFQVIILQVLRILVYLYAPSHYQRPLSIEFQKLGHVTRDEFSIVLTQVMQEAMEDN